MNHRRSSALRYIFYLWIVTILLVTQPVVAQTEPVPLIDLAVQQDALLPAFAPDALGNWHQVSIRATVDPVQRTLTGTFTIAHRGPTPQQRMVFWLYPNLRDFGGSLRVSNVTVNGQAVTPLKSPRPELLVVPVADGMPALVSMDFVAKTPLNGSRKFYGAFNREERLFTLASAFPMPAVVRDGGWDTAVLDGKGDYVNSETMLFDVTLTATAEWALLTTGALVSQQITEGMVTARFVSGPQRDFLIAAAQLRTLETTIDGTTVRLWVRPNTPNAEAALQHAARSLAIFNAQFGPYPLRELDVVAFDALKFYGVEYPGVVLIDHTLFSKPALLEQTIVHEVAHQWWYSQVGNDVQREAWLDEALASYAQVIYQREQYGVTAAERELAQFQQQYAKARNAPLAQHNSKYGKNYYAIVYAKGALFLDALRAEIGDAAFAAFWRDYYRQQRYTVSTGPALLESAERACGCELDGVYARWTR